jgi:hypothetical protein
MLSVIERARRYVAKLSPAVSGQGGHGATFHVAAVLVHGFALGEADAQALLREYNARCLPPWSEGELVHKVQSAATAEHILPRGYLLNGEAPHPGNTSSDLRPPSPQGGEGKSDGRNVNPHPACGHPLPSDGRGVSSQRGEGKADPVAVTVGFLDGFRCMEQDLAEASPVRLDEEWRFDGAVIVGALYQPGEQINFVTNFEVTPEHNGKRKARPKGCGQSVERNQLVARFRANGTDTSEAGGWLRMNPVDGCGIADVNVTAFRFALLESDTLPLDLQLSLFVRLALPVAAILSSGGSSYHAWVRLDARDVDEYRQTVSRLLGLVARFGVDGKNKNPSRLSRLPGAKRVIGATGDGIQRLLYLNPEPEQRRIFE